jgi:transcriptional regulator with XRE-family HTH domain
MRLIKIARKRTGMSQAELAVKIGISEPTMRRLEKGDPRVDPHTLARAAEELGMGFDWETGHVVTEGKVPAAAVKREMNQGSIVGPGELESQDAAAAVVAGNAVLATIKGSKPTDLLEIEIMGADRDSFLRLLSSLRELAQQMRGALVLTIEQQTGAGQTFRRAAKGKKPPPGTPFPDGGPG